MCNRSRQWAQQSPLSPQMPAALAAARTFALFSACGNTTATDRRHLSRHSLTPDPSDATAPGAVGFSSRGRSQPAETLRRQLGMRIILVSGYAVAASLALVGCSGAMNTPTAAAARSAPPPSVRRSAPPSAASSLGRGHHFGVCRSKDLAAGYLLGEGAGGQDYSVISLRNVGDSSCRLRGWPTVELLNRAHQPIGPAAGHHAFSAPKLVRLAPRQRAGVTISVGSVDVPTAAYCRQEATSTIALTLPGGAALTVPAVIQVCSRDVGLGTGPVRRGTSLAL
jgi:hypothetical protein